MDVRVRYAPSPTGLQHIGGVRTALFNYFFARSVGGKFILRLEDTDRTRFSEEYVQNLYDTFKWLGVYWDEGPDIGGPFGPYIQSERFDLYRKHALELVEKGKAYYCFCDAKRLEEMRASQGDAAGYDRHCRQVVAVEAARRVAAGEKAVIRLRIPLEGTTKFRDHLLGEIEWKNSDVNPDPVLLKSDGFPTYHLANVVDDHYMKISHVMRAQEWIPSTPLHVVMYEAFGWEHPEYCHLPMVMGQDGHKLSKRHGSTSVNEFRDSGYLPEALINYVSLLGWAFPDSRDMASVKDFERAFELDRLNKAPAVFDYKKLEWFNGQYIRALEPAKLATMLEPYFVKAGIFAAGDAAAASRLVAAIPLIRERISFLKDAPAQLAFAFGDIVLPAKEEFIPKKLDLAAAASGLGTVLELLPQLDALDEHAFEARIREVAEAKGVKIGDILMPTRVAITGSKVSPPLIGSMKLLGAATCRQRLQAALDYLKS